MKIIKIRHLWNRGNSWWIEADEVTGDKYLCSSSYVITKEFTRGQEAFSCNKIAEDKYSEIIEKEAAFTAAILKKEEEEKKEKQRAEKAARRKSPVQGRRYKTVRKIFSIPNRRR